MCLYIWTEKEDFICPIIQLIRQYIFVRTNEKDGTKLNNLKDLIVKGKDIVSTHALFKRIDNELIELIEMQGYTLILD